MNFTMEKGAILCSSLSWENSIFLRILKPITTWSPGIENKKKATPSPAIQTQSYFTEREEKRLHSYRAVSDINVGKFLVDVLKRWFHGLFQ